MKILHLMTETVPALCSSAEYIRLYMLLNFGQFALCHAPFLFCDYLSVKSAEFINF